MARKTVLIVDDEAGVRTLLRRCLEDGGFRAIEATNVSEVLAALNGEAVDLITLDLNLNDENGLDIAKAVRKVSNLPIIMVTGRGDVIDRIVGLEIGADDYIAKPFHLREVLARVHSVLRRASGNMQNASVTDPDPDTRALNFAGFRAIPATMQLLDPQGEVVELTSGDFRLLQIFLDRPRRVLSREQIMDMLNGIDWSPLDRTIDNQVARLRKKIETIPGEPKLIKTVRGVGYIFTPDVSVITQLADQA
ncbi:MAG: response regulator [Pseudorhodobacter sp.]